MSKIQIWKRITTNNMLSDISEGLYLICQRYKFESESQHTGLCRFLRTAVFNMSKIQIWKRITTKNGLGMQQKRLYLICQRYKFESESQQPHKIYPTYTAVFNMSKIQIWKRITTESRIEIMNTLLYLICQRYKFESESQLNSLTRWCFSSCI